MDEAKNDLANVIREDIRQINIELNCLKQTKGVKRFSVCQNNNITQNVTIPASISDVIFDMVEGEYLRQLKSLEEKYKAL